MADLVEQCIICLENLDGGQVSPKHPPFQPEAPGAAELVAAASTATTTPRNPADQHHLSNCNPSLTHQTSDGQIDNSHAENDAANAKIAVLDGCEHVLHLCCIQQWTEKANSCPICRQSFNLVNVFDQVGGTKLSSYVVEDKKQVPEFDPVAWAEANPEPVELEIDDRPCLVCGSSDNEQFTLLCDSCDAPYHTFCIDLDEVPHSQHWFCMECQDVADLYAVEEDELDFIAPNRASLRRTHFFPRTRQSVRRARRHTRRADAWRDTWGQVTGSVYEALGVDLDLDYDEEVDEELLSYRRAQQLRERESREFQRWEQRLHIASRAGARDAFQNNLPNVFASSSRSSNRAPESALPSPEELQSWRTLEMVLETNDIGNNRKRKERSESPTAPADEPKRKLKRPRTRRIATPADRSSSSSSKAANPGLSVRTSGFASASENNAPSGARSPQGPTEAPSFLSSLLQEIRDRPSSTSGSSHHWDSYHASSPATSPSASGMSSPIIPGSPPFARSISPLSLSTHIEPVYPKANYSPSRSSHPRARTGHSPTRGDQHSDSEVQSSVRRHPRQREPQIHRSRSQDASAQRQQTVVIRQRSPDASPTRGRLSLAMKENISKIVRGALKPHWSSRQMTPEQYEAINRAVSHKLYSEIMNPDIFNEESRRMCETIATQEVARAVAELKA